MRLLAASELRAIMPRAPIEFLDPLNTAMERFESDTPARQAMFLANIAHESGEFRYMQELANGEAYEDREDLENNLPQAKACAPNGKAGPWFKGHGPMQITGYKNHKKYSMILYGDETILLKDPRRLCLPFDGCHAAAAFVEEEGCLAAADAGNFLLYCQIINLPPALHGTARLPNGWVQRLAYYDIAVPILRRAA